MVENDQLSDTSFRCNVLLNANSDFQLEKLFSSRHIGFPDGVTIANVIIIIKFI